MKKNWLSGTAILSMVLFSAVAVAQQKNEFSINQCVEYANKNSVTVKNALLDVQIQNQTNRQITAVAFPQVGGSIGNTHYFDVPTTSLPDFISPSTYQVLIDQGVKNGSGQPITLPTGGFGTIPAKFGTAWNASGGIDLSQLLFDGQVFVGLLARSAVLNFSKKNVEITEEQIKTNIHKIYYQLLIGKKQLESLSDNILRFEKLLHDTKEYYKNGFAEKLDVDKVTVQINNIKTEIVKFENILTTANSGLKFLIGMPQTEELILIDTLSEEALKENILNQNYDYKDRKEIQLLNIAEKLGEYNISRYKLSKIPTIAAFASYSKNAQRGSFNFFNKGDWFTTSIVGFKMAIPIFLRFLFFSRLDRPVRGIGPRRFHQRLGADHNVLVFPGNIVGFASIGIQFIQFQRLVWPGTNRFPIPETNGLLERPLKQFPIEIVALGGSTALEKSDQRQ
ncbi:MAG: TolC family protein, partial [Ferruginibacter sp.]